jgi:hypothetical protein
MKLVDLTGTRSHRWTIVRRVPNTPQGQARWLCRCDCGTERVLKSIVIRRGISKSCGCFRADENIRRFQTHGHSTAGVSPTYHSWCGMLARCTNPSHRSFARYGARGITVCDRWKQFDNFLADMGEKPDGTSLDRIDFNRGYIPGNCRWATPREQARNKRNNYLITIEGMTHCVAEWAELFGIRKDLIWERRQRGWSDVEAVVTPPKKLVKRA